MDFSQSELMVQDALKGAKKRSDNNTIHRRQQHERSLGLSQSSSPSDKIQAARTIHLYFSEFPDLEEQAIDAVYDLCEDPLLQVRLEGYRAISRISKADSKFLKRNTDVLFQLLQNDDRSEIEVVKQALFDHIAMGPRVTFGVLCDQLLPAGADADDEEKTIREQLRTLVINFLEQQVIPLCIKPGSASEDALFESLCELVPQLNIDSIQRVINNVILKLPSYRTLSSPRGEHLMNLLLERAVSESKKTTKPSVSLGLPFLDIAQRLTINYEAPTLPLFQHYSHSLIGRVYLQQLPNPQKIRVIKGLAALLDFCYRARSADPQIQQHRWKIVDATPLLIEVLLSAGYISNSLVAFSILIRNCSQRKKGPDKWAVPSALLHAISQLEAAIDKLQPSQDRRELRNMISLLLTTSNPEVSTANAQATTPNTQPIAATQHSKQPPPSRPPSTAGRNQGSTLAPGPSIMTLKRKQSGDVNENQPRQSLLNRLQSSEPSPAVNPKPHAPPTQSFQGLSIKGAASLSGSDRNGRAPTPNDVPTNSREPLKTDGGGSFSLLARLADTSSASSEPGSISESRQRKKRKR